MVNGNKHRCHLWKYLVPRGKLGKQGSGWSFPFWRHPLSFLQLRPRSPYLTQTPRSAETRCSILLDWSHQSQSAAVPKAPDSGPDSLGPFLQTLDYIEPKRICSRFIGAERGEAAKKICSAGPGTPRSSRTKAASSKLFPSRSPTSAREPCAAQGPTGQTQEALGEEQSVEGEGVRVGQGVEEGREKESGA